MESKSIYDKNKETNKEKLQFFNFLMYATKGEIAIDEFQTNLFWTGATEAFVFLFAIILFITKPSKFWPLLFFITHLLRSICGFFILKYIPSSSKIINNLNKYENLPVNEIEKSIYSDYRNLISSKLFLIKKLLLVYWGITFLNIIEDIIIFCCFISTWGRSDYNFRNIVTLVLICILLTCDFVFIIWFGSFRIHYPPEISSAITKSVFGEIKNLRNIIGPGFFSNQQSIERKVEVIQNRDKV